MRTTDIGVWKVGLMAKYGEYNCGNKTTGRLELVVTNGKSNTNHGSQQVIKELQDDKIRDKIIKNFLEDIVDHKSHIALKDGCSFFPSDGGVYPPGVLLYADSIRMDKSITWYNNWKGLIEVFETESKFGVTILKSPIIPNVFYGPGKPSRVWTILLPKVAIHACFDRKTTSAAMKETLTAIAQHGCESKILKAELKELGIAV